MQNPFQLLLQRYGRPAIEIAILSHSIPPSVHYFFNAEDLILSGISNFELWFIGKKCDPVLLPYTHIHKHLYAANSDTSDRWQFAFPQVKGAAA